MGESNEAQDQEQPENHKNEVAEQTGDPFDAVKLWLKEDTPEQVVTSVHKIVTQKASIAAYSGPLPTAEQYALYEKVLPGTADRIVGMAEREQEFRMQNVKLRIGLERRRVNSATIVSLTMIAIAGIGIWQGFPWSIVVPFGLSGMITFFLRELTKVWRHRP